LSVVERDDISLVEELSNRDASTVVQTALSAALQRWGKK